MPNDVLKDALRSRNMTPQTLAERVGCDPQTVYRWMADPPRVPKQRLRWLVAGVLEVDEVTLWPNAVRATFKTGPDREVTAVYPTRAAMPRDVWERLVDGADRELMLCGYTSYFLWLDVPGMSEILRAKAEAGVRVRFVLGDPDAELTSRRIGADDGSVPGVLSLAARIAHTQHELHPLRGLVEVRQSDLGWGREVWRGDDEAVASWNVLGRMGSESPVLHLHRRQAGGLFDQVAVRHAEALWQAATPVWPGAG